MSSQNINSLWIINESFPQRHMFPGAIIEKLGRVTGET